MSYQRVLTPLNARVQDCGTALVDVLAGFMFDAFGAPTTLIFIAVRATFADALVPRRWSA